MIPYILHFETRIGIKLLTLIPKEGLTNAKGQLLPEPEAIRN